MEQVRISDLRQDRELQCRVEMDHFIIEDYSAVLANSGELPPITVFRDERGVMFVPDGHHRIAAHERQNRTHINADVRPGTIRDAILFACGANEEHGMRRSVKDRQVAVFRLLDDPMWCKMPLREMAKVCKVSVGFIHGAKEKWEAERGKKLPNRNPNKARHKEPEPKPDPDPIPPMPTLTLHAPCKEEESGWIPVPDDEIEENGWIPVPDDEIEPEVIKDAVGQAVPAKLAHLFADVARFKGAINALNLARREMTELMDKHPSTSGHRTSIQSDIDNAKSAIRTVMPFAVCPACKGAGCKKKESPCRTLGYATEDAFNQYQKIHGAAA